MKINYKLALTLLAGVALGAAAIQALHAQAKPPVYAIIEVNEITDAAAYSAVTQRPTTATAATAQGARYLARGGKITALDGTPPQRFVIIAFDSVEKAKAWNDSPDQKAIVAIRNKAAKARSFVVDGL
jgi:uncharacterized protein (DUF1330 family)